MYRPPHAGAIVQTQLVQDVQVNAFPPAAPCVDAPASLPGAPGILLVNDDARTLFALRAVLGDLDAVLVSASSGEQALLRLLKQDFALIILDVKMAGMDGFETARIIHQRPRSRATPIIFLTSHRATDIDRAAGFELGAVDYLFMPVAPEVLKARVLACIDAARARRGPAESDGAGSVDAERLIVEQAGEFVALLDSNANWLSAGASYQRDFGLPIHPGGSYLSLVHSDDRGAVAAVLAQCAPGEAPRRLQFRVLGDEERHFESDCFMRRSAIGALHLVLVSRDITQRKEMEAYVLHQSFHDSLTGLPNRMLLRDRLGQATTRRPRQRAMMAVLFIDLDHFKDVNDTLGHAAGDRLLQDVAERLAGCVRDGDTVARLGGDEFVILLTGLQQVQDVALAADKIVAAVATPCHIEGRELIVWPSVGIAVFPDDGTDPDTLLRNADTAMYHAKNEGGGRFSFFTAQMQEAASSKLALGAALQRAIGGGEFRMHYQPKVNARTGAITSFEALIRWPQADGSSIAPSLFIPIAEETGRIEPIGRFALDETVRELQRWRALGYGDVPIAVNMSALQFRRDDVAGTLAHVVASAGIAPSVLEVELTETGVMSNPALAIDTLYRIHGLGITVSIDDFGTGQSSLAYLKRLPID